MSYNIRIGIGMDQQTNLKRIAEVINKIQPDYVGLQEVDSVCERSGWINQYAELARLTGMYPIFAPATERSKGLYGIAALSRKKPRSYQYIPLPGKEEPRTFLCLEYPNYTLCNTHFSLDPDSRLASIRLINFDEPAAIDFNLLVKHLKELKAGHSIEQPIYSFLTCTRSNETITVEPRDIVIVEGILILCNEELRNMMDMKVFVDADADDRLIRVINRDIIERGRTVEMVIERYERVLKPMHLQHIEPTKRYADIIIPQGGHNSVAIEIMTNFISHKLKG